MVASLGNLLPLILCELIHGGDAGVSEEAGHGGTPECWKVLSVSQGMLVTVNAYLSDSLWRSVGKRSLPDSSRNQGGSRPGNFHRRGLSWFIVWGESRLGLRKLWVTLEPSCIPRLGIEGSHGGSFAAR